MAWRSLFSCRRPDLENGRGQARWTLSPLVGHTGPGIRRSYIGNQMKTIEICSYPKSGNTWVRHLVYQFLIDSRAKDVELPQDIHDDPEYVINKRKAILTPFLSERVSFYKSHILDNKSVTPDRIIYIYRHPIDVFLSARNWFYKNSPKFKEERRKKIFIDGIPKSIDEIYHDGSLSTISVNFRKSLEAITGEECWAIAQIILTTL